MQFKRQIPALLIVILFILGIRSMLIEPFRIPTRSMLPGLMVGDFLFASKFYYGFHLPFSEWLLDHPIYLGQRHAPDRGDIVIFTPPEAGQDNLYIKRVIGVPGDQISFSGKNFFINGTMIQKSEILGAEREAILNHPGFDPEERYNHEKLHLYHESLNRNNDSSSAPATYTVVEDDAFEAGRTPDEIQVPADNYFVLGDNRDDTRDSRVFGVIPFTAIRGKAFVIWLSYRVSMSDSRWSFRAERIGRKIR